MPNRPNPPKRPTSRKPARKLATTARGTPKPAAQPGARTRKKTAASPVAGRITALRQRGADKTHAAPPRTTAPAKATARRGFPDVESATRYLLKRAEELVQDGVRTRLPFELYLDALVPVLRFIHGRAAIFAEANLGPEVCGAVEHIAAEIQAAPANAVALVAVGQVPENEAISTGALLLTAYRDAVGRVARGPRGLLARNHYGVGDPLDVRDPEQVASGIERFLQGAIRYPGYLDEAGLARKQLDGLAAQRRVIVARAKERLSLRSEAVSSAQTVRVLHAALEYFFDRFSAAVSAKLFDQPEERVRGLRLVPRDSSFRAGGLRATDPR